MWPWESSVSRFKQITPTATWKTDLGERVEWVKVRRGDQSGDLQEVWTPVVAVNLPEVKDGPSVFFGKLLWSSRAFPLVLVFLYQTMYHVDTISLSICVPSRLNSFGKGRDLPLLVS